MTKKLFATLALLTAIGGHATAKSGSILEKLHSPAATVLVDNAETSTAYAAKASKVTANAALKPVSDITDGPTLYGWISYNENWDSNKSDNYGIYSFPAAADTRFEKILTTNNVSAAANADGRLCGYYVLNYGGAIAIRYYMYDQDSGELKAEKAYNSSNVTDIYTHYAYTLAYNHKDATLYGEFFRAAGDDVAVCLSKIDQLTGVPTEVVELNTGSVLFVAMAFDPDGNLYAIGDNGSLYNVDTATGDIEEIGATSIRPQDPQCAYIDATTGKMYWAALTTSLDSGFYEVDLSTGHASLLSEWPGTTWMVGMYGEHSPLGKTPAQISDLAVTYSSNTALDAKITFTVPTQAADGSSLSGSLGIDVYVDYTKLSSGIPTSVTPGEAVSIDQSFSAGQHKVEVQLNNDAGYGDRDRLLTFAGKDTPGAPTDVTFTLADRTATVSWQAPATGAHGGWFDSSALTYTVVRQPDNTTVETGLSATSITDEIPDRLGNYFYEITSVTTETGATATSNRILYGTAMTVPYTETFDTEAPLDLFTFDDANGDGYYWKWKNGAMMDPRGEADDAADWLITPPIALTTDWIYKLTFDAHAIGSYYTEQFNAGIADTPEGAAMTTLGSYTVNGETYVSFEAVVEIDAAGNYYLGIQHSTPAPNTNRDELYIDNIRLEPFISTAAPASVDDLAVTIHPDDPLKGTMSFKAPTKAINGSAISSLTKIEIFLDGTLVETKTSVTPGQLFDDIDVDVPQGEHTFNVIAHNDIDRGHDTEISVFGGIDIPLPVTDISYEWNPTNDNKATLRWDAPGNQGIHGLEIPSITYNILYPLWGGFFDEATGITACSYELTVASLTSQTLVQRGIQAVSAGGKSSMEQAIVNLGPAIPLDVYESFSGGATNYTTWAVSSLSGQARWGMYNSNPSVAEAQDGDNGYAMCTPGETGGEDRLVSPAFDFSSTEPAFLHLWVLHSSAVGAGTTLSFETTTNGCDYTPLGQTISINNGTSEWKEYTIPLDRLAGARKAIIGFRANVPDAESFVAIDNIVIDHQPSSGIEDISYGINGSHISISTTTGAIVINGAAGQSYTVYTPDGKPVATGTAASDSHTTLASPGIYLVKAGDSIAKVAVR